MPVLADVPTLVHGLILEEIRKKMFPAERVHFIPILQHAAGWKKVVQFAATDDAYIVALDSGGQIKWRTHGTMTGEAYIHEEMHDRVSDASSVITNWVQNRLMRNHALHLVSV